MLRKKALTIAAAVIALGLGSTVAFSDDYSGRDHAGGAILGGIAGGLPDGAVTHGILTPGWRVGVM